MTEVVAFAERQLAIVRDMDVVADLAATRTVYVGTVFDGHVLIEKESR